MDKQAIFPVSRRGVLAAGVATATLTGGPLSAQEAAMPPKARPRPRP